MKNKSKTSANSKESKTNHSFGPWFMCEQATKPHHQALIGIGNGAVHVGYASVTPALGLIEADANARLIAAAPELLEALLTIEHEMGKVISAKAFDEFSEDAKTKLQAALLKAIPSRSNLPKAKGQ